MEKIVRIIQLKDINDDKFYWMSKTPQERIAAIEFLREQYIKTLPDVQQRFQRICRIINRKQL